MGGLPLSYQWQQNGTNLTDGAYISGSRSTALTLAGLTLAGAGSYTVVVSNSASAVTSSPPAILTVLTSLQLVQNGGFETGAFTNYWTLSGNWSGNMSVSPGGTFAHSGAYGVKAGPSGSLAYLSQSLRTMPRQSYVVSLWLDSPAANQFPNEFSVAWNGTNLFDQTDLPKLGWTNLQFTVAATATNTVLQFGFRDDPDFLGLDDVSVLPLGPMLGNVGQHGGMFTFSWSAQPNFLYQIQSTTNLTQTNWAPVGGPVTATNILMTASCQVGTNNQQFYRVALVP